PRRRSRRHRARGVPLRGRRSRDAVSGSRRRAVRARRAARGRGAADIRDRGDHGHPRRGPPSDRRALPGRGLTMADNAGRVAVYLDFDNIVISWYDRVHGRNAYGKDRQRIADDPHDAAVAERLKQAMIEVGAIIDYASSFGTL